MADFIELKATDLAAMLCSRVCHDLINPVGAIGNCAECSGESVIRRRNSPRVAVPVVSGMSPSDRVKAR